MKKTVVKKLIAAVLAVSTITASAALFTGCGKNEAPAVSGAQSSGAATESSQQATETSGPIDLKGFLSEIVDKKQYTVKVEDYVATDPKIGFPGKALFKLVANSPIEADGYTFTKTTDEEQEVPNSDVASYKSEWEISSGDKKLGTFELSANYEEDWGAYKKTNLFNIYAGKKTADNASSSAVEIKSARGEFEIDVPPMMTDAECKQHLPEIEKMIEDTVSFGDYKDKKLEFNSIYYGKETKGLGAYDLVTIHAFYSDDEGNYYEAAYEYPFMDSTQVKAVNSSSVLWESTDPAYIGENNPNILTWIKLK